MAEPISTLAAVRSGSRRALGRALSTVERRGPEGEQLISALRDGVSGLVSEGMVSPPVGCVRLGITGAPGVGKSSLVAQLVRRFRKAGERVAVLAVDPTSPLSGGALLGDRVRMRGFERDDGVFIRSLASRSGSGGLAGSTDEAAELVAAAGYGVVLIETVGVGQLELAVTGEADLVYLMVSPESGDLIQFLKGGVVEVVDRLVVNKIDRPGWEATLRVAREVATERGDAEPLAVSCESGRGLDEFVQTLLADVERTRMTATEEREAPRWQRRLERRAEQRWLAACWTRAGGQPHVEDLAREVGQHKQSFRSALDELIARGLTAPGSELPDPGHGPSTPKGES